MHNIVKIFLTIHVICVRCRNFESRRRVRDIFIVIKLWKGMSRLDNVDRNESSNFRTVT
jgi:hypothetical protein